MWTSDVDKPVVNMDDEQHDAEIRLMGLILAQSALVGVAVGVFDADVWLKNDTTWLNGFTYAMGAFFVQGIAYYVFKMFFEQSMRERARASQIDRQRTNKYRSMQQSFDSRRAEMEIRMQEAQLEAELRWMEANPGKMPPSWGVHGGSPSMVTSYDQQRQDNMRIPTHQAQTQQPLSLGAAEEGDVPLKKDGTPDKRYQKKNE
jgi:hypothetical protein|tara:strand:- start:2037 stop:2645 length:609 start_codon:yes stop_codon:yes gene_type:complete